MMITLANRKPFRLQPILLHASAWILYALFIFCANYIANHKLKYLQTLYFLLPLCMTFYLAVYFLQLFKQRRVAGSIASFFIVFAIMASVAYLYYYVLLPAYNVQLYRSTGFKDYIKAAVLGYVQYFSYALLYFYVREFIRKERRLRIAEREKLTKELENAELKRQELQAQSERQTMEYAFLRAQINPHFLHNSLNVLYSQAFDYSDELAENILKLSRIMRYSLEGVAYYADRVGVEEELNHLSLLLEFYQLRFNDSKYIRYKIEGEAEGQQVLPLTFITIVENAFKYGDLKDRTFPLQILVRLTDGKVEFNCTNKKRISDSTFTSHHIGLDNLKRRLDVNFPNNYLIDVKNEELFYRFSLTLNTPL
jgi:sensor histidine kinase YesM